MTAPTPPQAERVWGEQLAAMLRSKKWPPLVRDVVLDLLDSRAESARLREQLHALEVDRKDMSLLIRRLCSKWHALRSPERVNEALDYLKRKGLMGNPLRDTDALAGKE